MVCNAGLIRRMQDGFDVAVSSRNRMSEPFRFV
jgi:hypothetical protein